MYDGNMIEYRVNEHMIYDDDNCEYNLMLLMMSGNIIVYYHCIRLWGI